MIVGIHRPVIALKLFLTLCLSLNKNIISCKIENIEMLTFKFPENQSVNHGIVPIIL